MIKRTLEISTHPSHLRMRYDQLEILQKVEGEERKFSVPCEDIGLLMVDQHETTYTHAALAQLMEAGAAVVLCGKDHLPAGLLLPLAEHTEVVWRLDAQLSMSAPLSKQLWKQIVQAKILAQAKNLDSQSPPYQRLKHLAESVRSGDPENVEAQAARVYWSAWLGEGKEFHRNPKGKDSINVLLNYGYTIARATVARALVSAGLLPALGIHHANRSNAFCLADDLMEPLRPMIDKRVRKLQLDAMDELNRDTKGFLLDTLTQTVQYGTERGPLMTALHTLTASYVNCLEGREKELIIPESN